MQYSMPEYCLEVSQVDTLFVLRVEESVILLTLYKDGLNALERTITNELFPSDVGARPLAPLNRF